MKCEFGFCLVCEAEIAPKCQECSVRKPGGSYTEVFLPLSNGSKMVVAVCLECKDKIWHEDRDAVMNAIKAAWDKAGNPYDKELAIVH